MFGKHAVGSEKAKEAAEVVGVGVGVVGEDERDDLGGGKRGVGAGRPYCGGNFEAYNGV